MNSLRGGTKAAIGIAIATTLAAAPLLTATAAHANPVSGHSNCDIAPWGFLGSQRRLICDSPIVRDGSWTRERVVYTPAHFAPSYSSCSGGSYSYCTFYQGGFVDDYITADDTYTVTADTVLADEPGHLGAAPTGATV